MKEDPDTQEAVSHRQRSRRRTCRSLDGPSHRPSLPEPPLFYRRHRRTRAKTDDLADSQTGRTSPRRPNTRDDGPFFCYSQSRPVGIAPFVAAPSFPLLLGRSRIFDRMASAGRSCHPQSKDPFFGCFVSPVALRQPRPQTAPVTGVPRGKASTQPTRWKSRW